jgi:hypothetical protein
MNKITINENIEIKNEREIFTIQFKNSNYALINSLLKTNIIRGGATDESYKIVKFKAQSVKTLQQYMTQKIINNGKKGLIISDTAKIIRSLSLQLNYLIEIESNTILGYDPSLIIVLNEDKFAYLGDEYILSIEPEGKKMAMISSPFFLNDFFASLELLKVSIIPSFIHYKTAYFSFGLLIMYALLGDNYFYLDFLNHNDIKYILIHLSNHPIKNTRIYWLISRCLVEDPLNRSIILI